MTAEGFFPKIDGDVLYSSEVNGFYNLTGSPLYKNTTGSIFYKGDAGLPEIGSLVFTNISGLVLLNLSYYVYTYATDFTEESISSLNPYKPVYGYVTIGAAKGIQTERSIVMNNNGSYVFSMGFAGGHAGSVILGSIYIFGGQPGMAVTSSF